MTGAALASLLPLAVAIPLAGGAVALLVARLSGRLAIIVSIGSLLGSTAILVAVAPKVYGGDQVTHYLGHWVPVNGAALGIAFSADAWGLTYALTAAGIG
ncbi:MAG: hypothetical protein QOK39_547, partial [Acidimicrobiaceae bacterium]|nr:hypothetical protein [Acidimicrobiaceae bacterium]